jgi:hypothetical protein
LIDEWGVERDRESWLRDTIIARLVRAV